MENTTSMDSIQTYYAVLVTINFTLSILVMLLACLFCKRKTPKNDLLGLEGMVKLKNPDEVIIITSVGGGTVEQQTDLNASVTSTADSEKRASTAAHRSLPDIPMVDTNGDNGSELYETVAEKRLGGAENNNRKSPNSSLKKQMSVSQHSSISQADDVSSPYSRVKNNTHDYAKVRSTEHPYAQLNPPTTSGPATNTTATNTEANLPNGSVHRVSHNSDSIEQLDGPPVSAEIPAASAIAGMISASQDLPYMTPPITNQHFSGDSQDSSKGYTSISVREPLANILAQQPVTKSTQRNPALSRDISDSHYATVSDDSDETYAAIENPHAPADIYTSGSETYAQIQPMQPNPIVVSAEINHISAPIHIPPVISSNANTVNNSQIMEPLLTTTTTQFTISHNNRPLSEHSTPIPPPVDSLRAAQMHSRQASFSSNNSSSVGNIGSPKPEKRQANSPLPPTPKSNQLHATSTGSNLTSGRSSIISVIEYVSGSTDAGNGITSSVSTTTTTVESSPQKKHKSLSPSKDIEGMYAKVMKKNKFSRNQSTSQNNSPVLTRKLIDEHSSTQLGVTPLDATTADLMDSKIIPIESIVANRMRSNSDHGYETIPAAMSVNMENRKSDCYAHIIQKERQQSETNFLNLTLSNPTIPANIEKHYETIANSINDPGYETLNQSKQRNSSTGDEKKTSDYDPNYEVLKCPDTAAVKAVSAGLSDDGYAKVLEKNRFTNDTDSIDGYSKVRSEEHEDSNAAGYSTIAEPKLNDANHNYASILETKANDRPTKLPPSPLKLNEHRNRGADEEEELELDHHYARISDARIPPVPDLTLNLLNTPVKLYDGDTLSPPPPPPDLPIMSPSSINSSSMLNNSSIASSTPVTTSTSTMSSHQTPSSSQYESFTGSDTDPNYESVSYFNNENNENPYQRLQPDLSDAQSSSPTQTPDDSTTLTAAPMIRSETKMSNTPNGTKPKTDDSSTEIIIEDYVHV